MKRSIVTTFTFLIITTLLVTYFHGQGPQNLQGKQLKIEEIKHMISKVEKNMDDLRQETLAKSLANVSERYQIDAKILIAIIDTESDFRHEMISKTGDVSLAQINPRIWDKELLRLGRAPLDKKQLKVSEEYAIERMTEILSIIKLRYEKRDSHWYARYHSNTKKHRKFYQHKLGKKLNLIAASELHVISKN